MDLKRENEVLKFQNENLRRKMIEMEQVFDLKLLQFNNRKLYCECQKTCFWFYQKQLISYLTLGFTLHWYGS